LLNNALIKVNGYELLLDEGFVETHRGESYNDYIVDGRFLYTGNELILDSNEEVHIQIIHPAIGKIERTLVVPMSVRKVQLDSDQLDSWLAGDVTSIALKWTGVRADRYRIVVLALIQDGRTERTIFDTNLLEAHINRTQLNVPGGFDFTSHRLEIEIIASSNLDFDLGRVHFAWTLESPFARRLILE
jgi:hypothetical protein